MILKIKECEFLYLVIEETTTTAPMAAKGAKGNNLFHILKDWNLILITV